MTIKGQALAKFIAEFTYINTSIATGIANDVEAVKVVEVGNDENSITDQEDTSMGPLR